MVAAVLATLLFCVSAVSANRATRLIGSIEANFWRLICALVLLALWAHGIGQGLGGRGFPMFFASGVIGFGLGDIALYLAYPRLGSRLTLLLVHCLAAPLAAAAEWIFLGTTLKGWEIFWSAIILSGVGLALAPGENPHLDLETILVGGVFGLLAAFGQGLGAVTSRIAYAMNASEGFFIDGFTAAYQRILGGLLLGILAYGGLKWRVRIARKRVRDSYGRDGERKPGLAWPWILLTSLAGPTLGVGCYQWALEKVPSGLVLPIVATAPLVVMPLSWIMEADRPTWRAFAGGALAVAGVIGLGVS